MRGFVCDYFRGIVRVQSKRWKSARHVLRRFYGTIFHASVRKIFVPKEPVRVSYWEFNPHELWITGNRYGYVGLSFATGRGDQVSTAVHRVYNEDGRGMSSDHERRRIDCGMRRFRELVRKRDEVLRDGLRRVETDVSLPLFGHHAGAGVF